jgi:peptidoglycan hydrolase-like protein with peptidoglycan-binding domain
VLLAGGLALACERRQPERKPAPATALETPALRATDGASEWRVTDKDVLFRLQRRLQDLAIYPGPVDGRYRDELRLALSQFQAARGLPATGKLDSPTADALGLRAADVRPPAGAAPPPSAPTAKPVPSAPPPRPAAPAAKVERKAPSLPPAAGLPSIASGPGGSHVDRLPAPPPAAPAPPPPESTTPDDAPKPGI